MEICSLRNAPAPERGDTVFGYSRVYAAIGMIVISAIILGSLAFGLAGGGRIAGSNPIPPGVCYWVAGAMSFIALFTFPNELKKFAATNWLVRLGSGRLVIKYRSTFNAHFAEDDPQIVDLPFSEIVSVREVQETMQTTSLSGGRSRTCKVSYLEMKVASAVDTSVLEEALTAERNRPAPMGRFSSSRTLHFPVSVPQPGLLRIEWSGVVPKLPRALSIMSRQLAVEEPVDGGDRRDIAALAEDEKHAAIRKLARSGDTIGAIKMTRSAFGWSLAQAKQYVDGIVSAAESSAK